MKYNRPYFGKYCSEKTRRAAPQYPYDLSILQKYDALEVFPLDGGGFFFTQELVGGLKNKQFISALQSGKMLEPWRISKKPAKTPSDIDWMACYDESMPSGHVHQVLEQHVWLHRWYFMLPLAQEYLRTGDKKYVDQWFSFFEDWNYNFANFTQPKEELSKGIRRILTDMQSVWRLMVMIHSVAMFERRGGGGALKQSQWTAIYKSIESHSRRTYDEGLKQMAGGGGFNHFLHKGNALIYAGTLFPEFKDSDKWVTLGRKIISWYKDQHTYMDGGSREGCPSYSHFIVRLYLDAYTLLKENGRASVKGLRKSIDSQYKFLANTSTPDWRTLRWSDSYSLDVGRDLEVAQEVFPFKVPTRTKSIVYPESQVAILRDKDTVVYVDAMPGGIWHMHRGKPHIEVFYRDKPVFVDPGCVNYDRDAEREGYLKTRQAHNVVTVEPVENDEWPGTSTFYEMSELADDGKSVTAKCIYKGKGTKYTWTRTVSIGDDVLNVVDKVVARKDMDCILHFHLAESKASARKNGFSARSEAWSLVCKCENDDGDALGSSVKRCLAMDSTNERFKAPDVTFKQSGRKVIFKTVIKLSS